jgi:hypothetical protein
MPMAVVTTFYRRLDKDILLFSPPVQSKGTQLATITLADNTGGRPGGWLIALYVMKNDLHRKIGRKAATPA